MVRWLTVRGSGVQISCVAIATIAAVAAVPQPRLTSAFLVAAHRTPRYLTSDREVTVRLLLSNTGSEPWVPDQQFNVSYHWWSAFGEKVKYNGLRSALPRIVEPLESVSIDARLRAPGHPGVYRLQWDVVQENVKWLSEQDPDGQLQFFVVVGPDWITLFLPAPGAIAILGLLLVRRRRHRSDTSWVMLLALSVIDTVWCATSLMAKQLFLTREIALPVTMPQVMLRLLVALVVPITVTLALGTRRRPWLLWAIAAGGTLIVVADVVYFRFFHDVISAAVLPTIGQLGHLESSVFSLVALRDLWPFADVAIAVPLVAAVARLDVDPPIRRAQQLLALSSALLIGTGGYALRERVRQQAEEFPTEFRTLTVVQELGIFAFHALDTWAYVRSQIFKPPLEAAQLAEAERWFAERAPHRAGSGTWFGAVRGRNLIVIQVESLQAFVVGLQINGQEITPNLNRWRNENLWFSNVTDQTNEGRTSDCEFLSLTSLLPLDRGAVAFRYPTGHYTALPGILNQHGYDTLSAVAFDSTFWNRRLTHPTYGFARSLFGDAFTPGRRIGWGLNDRDFLDQMAMRVAGLRRPFAAWLITLSLHHPFDEFPDDLKELDLGRWEGRPFGNYLHAMSFFDRAFGEFIGQLDRHGLLEETAVVVLGDHDAGFPWRGSIARAIGFPPHTLEWYLQDRVPLIIHLPHDALRGERTTTAGQADVAPTLLALLGIDPAPEAFVGRNLLGDPGHDPVVRPFGDWIDDRHLFVAGNGPPGKPICYDLIVRDEAPLKDCQPGTALAMRATEIGRLVLRYDLQQRLSHPLSGAQVISK